MMRKPEQLTQKDAIAMIRALGMSCRVQDGEFRITFRNVPAARAEELAYYTTCRADAVRTAGWWMGKATAERCGLDLMRGAK